LFFVDNLNTLNGSLSTKKYGSVRIWQGGSFGRLGDLGLNCTPDLQQALVRILGPSRSRVWPVAPSFGQSLRGLVV